MSRGGRRLETEPYRRTEESVSGQRSRSSGEPAGKARVVPGPGTDPLTVSSGVVVEMVRSAVLEVPGVLKVRRGGPLACLTGSPVKARLEDGTASVRIWIIARSGQPLGPLAAQVRQVATVTLQRLLGLQVSDVTVVVDGVGSPSS